MRTALVASAVDAHQRIGAITDTRKVLNKMQRVHTTGAGRYRCALAAGRNAPQTRTGPRIPEEIIGTGANTGASK